MVGFVVLIFVVGDDSSCVVSSITAPASASAETAAVFDSAIDAAFCNFVSVLRTALTLLLLTIIWELMIGCINTCLVRKEEAFFVSSDKDRLSCNVKAGDIISNATKTVKVIQAMDGEDRRGERGTLDGEGIEDCSDETLSIDSLARISSLSFDPLRKCIGMMELNWAFCDERMKRLEGRLFGYTVE